MLNNSFKPPLQKFRFHQIQICKFQSTFTHLGHTPVKRHQVHNGKHRRDDRCDAPARDKTGSDGIGVVFALLGPEILPHRVNTLAQKLRHGVLGGDKESKEEHRPHGHKLLEAVRNEKVFCGLLDDNKNRECNHEVISHVVHGVLWRVSDRDARCEGVGESLPGTCSAHWEDAALISWVQHARVGGGVKKESTNRRQTTDKGTNDLRLKLSVGRCSDEVPGLVQLKDFTGLCGALRNHVTQKKHRFSGRARGANDNHKQFRNHRTHTPVSTSLNLRANNGDREREDNSYNHLPTPDCVVEKSEIRTDCESDE
eukprot:comp22628_c1_seq1/m.34786 comp22628_c1_seq1/g.34786  ORF comp22628_c1_seq1/g.34786 comp22628_c1_seq1/m.34786 type:complete len:312 (+) comp22628_c1_seq1:236-1171(+)